MILGDREDECLKQNQTRWRASFVPHFSPGTPHAAMVVRKIFLFKKRPPRDLNVTRAVCHSAASWITVTAPNYQSISSQLTLA